MRRSSAADRSSRRRARRTAATRWRVRMASRVSIAATSVTATAVSPDGEVVAAVSRDTAFYRSDDGGATWPGP